MAAETAEPPVSSGGKPLMARSRMSGRICDRVLANSMPPRPSDVNQFVHTGEGRLEDDRPGSLRRNVAIHSERHSDGGIEHCGGVVDAVSEVERRTLRGNLADDLNLFLWTLASVDVRYAHPSRKQRNFSGPVTGQEDDLVNLVFCPKMVKKRLAFMARLVLEMNDASESAVNQDDAFQSGSDRRECHCQARCQLAAAGKRQRVSFDMTCKPLPGGFGHILGVEQPQAVLVSGINHSRGQRVFRILLDTRSKPKYVGSRPRSKADHFREIGPSVGQRSGFVDDERSARVEFLQDRRVFDHNAVTSSYRNRTDDRNRDRNQQRAGSSD